MLFSSSKPFPFRESILVDMAASSCLNTWFIVTSLLPNFNNSFTFLDTSKWTSGSVQPTKPFFSFRKASLGATRNFLLLWNSSPFHGRGKFFGFERTGKNLASRRPAQMEFDGHLPLPFNFASINESKPFTRSTAALLSTSFILPMLSALSTTSFQGRKSDAIPSCSSLASRWGLQKLRLVPKGNLPSASQNREEASLFGWTSWPGHFRLSPRGDTGIQACSVIRSSKSCLLVSRTWSTSISLKSERTFKMFGKKISRRNRLLPYVLPFITSHSPQAIKDWKTSAGRSMTTSSSAANFTKISNEASPTWGSMRNSGSRKTTWPMSAHTRPSEKRA